MINLGIIFLISTCAVSFGITYFLMPRWIAFAKKNKVLGRDMNKIGDVMIPEAGGIIVVTAIFFGLLYYAGVQVFHLNEPHILILTFGAIGSILWMGVIGALDDFRGWKIGLKPWPKSLATIPAALPFLLANFNRTTIDLPFFSITDVGIIFPLLFVPIAIVGASNAFNMLAGYNGLETGMGMLILGTLAFLSHLYGQNFAVVFCLIGFFALLAFFIYNWYPAKVFPGDTMTYPVGAFIAICAILGGVEKFALLLFIPYYLDFVLPLRKKMKVEAFAKVNNDGSLDPPYKSSYDTTHLVIFLLKKFKKKVYERDVVLTILGFEVFLAFLCILIAFLTRS